MTLAILSKRISPYTIRRFNWQHSVTKTTLALQQSPNFLFPLDQQSLYDVNGQPFGLRQEEDAEDGRGETDAREDVEHGTKADSRHERGEDKQHDEVAHPSPFHY